MNKTRVLVVDDAVVVRRVVSHVLSNDPALEVAGTAINGRIALAKLPQLQPDLVTLDLEMPEMDGLETLRALRRDHPRLPVIMLSRFTERGATTTHKAMTLGASDYVTLPYGAENINDAIQRIREQLIPKIKMLTRSTHSADANRAATNSQPASIAEYRLPFPHAQRRVDIVAIGVSTGGPDALAKILPALPAEFPVPIVIVQHMPPDFTFRLAAQLRSKSKIQVSEGMANDLIFPGHAMLAPGGHHMSVVRGPQGIRLQMSDSPAENYCRPSVDVLFRSVAEAYGAGTLAVVLTGLGRDGLRGCEQIRAAGGQIIVQDQASSVVWGMPGAVAGAGLADQIVPLNDLSDEITRRVRYSRTETARLN
ncbi:MAG: chemotaxis response regulator protein-glutamate methylesterase [Pirellulales bacterium]|nr:chemotaxis response regulator protein-glutamate methylesterase [Pirellulales bacterium]